MARKEKFTAIFRGVKSTAGRRGTIGLVPGKFINISIMGNQKNLFTSRRSRMRANKEIGR